MTSTNWRDTFEPRNPRSGHTARTGHTSPPGQSPEIGAAIAALGSAPAPQAPLDDIELALDLTAYKPWTLQRGRGRPAMMLELRRFEPRSGLWTGWQMSYPTLLAVEYTGDRLLSLDFGMRQFVIEGQGLDELARYLGQGNVIAVQEYASAVWNRQSEGPIVSSIRKVIAPSAFDA